MLATLSLITVTATAMAAGTKPNEPVRLANGDPLVGIYYFTHWWEPWKSSDEAILNDLRRLKSLGFNTIFLDHEWSQMIDGNWRLLDRGHKLAKEAGVQILPWLSAKVWLDIGNSQHRRDLIKQHYGVTLRTGTDPAGKDNNIVVPYDEATIVAGASYVKQYLDRYEKNGALLHLNWDGKVRPAAALTVELEWEGSWDETTQVMFRLWLKQRHGDVAKLNKAWGTTLTDFAEIDMRDTSVFDLGGHIEGKAKHPKAVEDHIEFRAQVIDTSLAAIRERVKKSYPDLVVITELPYQLESKHPHAIGYRVRGGANPSSAEHADVVLIRATGPLSDAEQKAHLAFKERTGLKTILTYRTYESWGPDLLSGKLTPKDMAVYPAQAAALAEGFGFYSFNEMVDTHLVADPDPPYRKGARPVTRQGSAAAMSAVTAMVAKYRTTVSGTP